MPKSNEEKYLASIDGTLKDILKELKRQNKPHILNVDGKELSKEVRENIRKEGFLKSVGDNPYIRKG